MFFRVFNRSGTQNDQSNNIFATQMAELPLFFPPVNVETFPFFFPKCRVYLELLTTMLSFIPMGFSLHTVCFHRNRICKILFNCEFDFLKVPYTVLWRSRGFRDLRLSINLNMLYPFIHRVRTVYNSLSA